MRRIEHEELEQAAAHPWPYGSRMPRHDMGRMATLINAERQRLYAQASPERRARMDAAAQRGRVFQAWNAVMAGADVSREKSHVTGLYYDEAKNALVVYVDSDAWVQELTMKREVLRTRMSFEGVEVSRITFRRSREDYRQQRRNA